MPAFKPFGLPDGVEPIPGEPLRFFVKSRTNPKQKYLVDLEECGFSGGCGCQNFQFTHLPKLKEDRREDRPRIKRRCWHIKRALYFFAETQTRIIAAHMNRKPA